MRTLRSLLRLPMAHSYAVPYFRARWLVARQARGFAERQRLSQEDVERRYEELDWERLGPQFPAVAERELGSISEWSRERGVPLLVANISRQPIEWLSTVMNRLGVPFLDLSRSIEGHDEYRFTIDPHYNARGHMAVASELEPWLRAALSELPIDPAGRSGSMRATDRQKVRPKS